VSPASAATCRFDPDGHALFVSAGSETATVVQQDGELQLLDPAGQRACLDGTATVVATVYNTDRVQIVSDGNVGIVPATGPFAPGFTPDPGGLAAIEFTVAFTLPGSSLEVAGTPGNDRLTVGSNGLDVDNDKDVDVQVFGEGTRWIVDGGDGNDVLSAQGGHGTGDALTTPVTFTGGAGDDRLTGGRGDDILLGGTGSDVLQGRSGNDQLAALDLAPTPGEDADARDSLDGGNGNDELIGGPGIDLLNGGLGDDLLRDADGTPDFLRGGMGRDTAWIDAGLDRVGGVETRL
jgi:Ca2+-binding RTX toxin-like protein